MEQHEVATIVEGQLRAATLGADGWPWAWAGGICESHGSLYLDVVARLGRDRHYELDVLFDRDRADLARARALTAELEAAWTAAHPTAGALVLVAFPTTRLEHALREVRGHLETCAIQERERMRRRDVPWVTLGAVEIVRGWTPALDRVRVEMYAESSADEGAAQALGEDWLRQLTATWPELAEVVQVVGASHCPWTSRAPQPRELMNREGSPGVMKCVSGPLSRSPRARRAARRVEGRQR